MNKCLVCGDKFNVIEDLYGHIDDVHKDEIPKNFSAPQYHYYMKTGKEHGSCVICKKDTLWNDATLKYHRFCTDPNCKKKYTEEFKKRMIGKYGRVHLLSDPDQQKKMLANRSISGRYKWSDGNEVPYTGTYELDFLKFLDVFMNFSSEDIISPSPHTYYYIYEGEEKFYMPDFFIPSLNLEIEIKDGGDNPNTHHKIQGVDKVKEKLKDAVLTSQKSFSYIKLTNKNYDAFFEMMMMMKQNVSEHGASAKPIYILNESVQVPSIVTESLTKKSSLFHLSTSNLDGRTLEPRVPENFFTRKGYEDAKTPRVSFSSSIDGCLIGMSDNLKGKTLYVHQPEDESAIKVKRVTVKEVPDAELTDEVWVTTPVKLQVVAEIKVGDAIEPALKYSYGTQTAETYKWNWKKIQSHVTESMGDITAAEIENERVYGTYNPTEAQRQKVDLDFSHEERRMQYFKQIAHPKATMSELRFVVEIMDAELRAMEDGLMKANNSFIIRIKKLKEDIRIRLGHGPLNESSFQQ